MKHPNAICEHYIAESEYPGDPVQRSGILDVLECFSVLEKSLLYRVSHTASLYCLGFLGSMYWKPLTTTLDWMSG